MIAILEAYRARLLTPKNIWQNCIAGLSVGVVALPLSIAFAIASGVTPQQGLYTAIIAGLVVGILGGSRVQISGPTGAFVVILASITAHYGITGLQVASFMAGAILLLMGLLKLGSVIKFIPEPVVLGFTSGIGVTIFVGEWKDFFGLSAHLPLDASFAQKIELLLQAIPTAHLATTGLAIISLALMLLTPYFFKRIPAPLAALISGTLLQSLFHFTGVATLGNTFGGLPHHLPPFHFPNASPALWMNVIPSAFTIALLGAIASLLSATAADGLAGTHHDSNQELLGQGLANMIAPLFGGFAATGAIARTVTSIRNKGNSPISAIIHSVFLILVIALLAPFALNTPLCTLAAILFVVSYNMSNVSHFIHTLKHAPKHDVFVLLITFLLTIFVNLVVSVSTGVILAMLFFVRRMTQSISIEQQSPEAITAALQDTTINIPNDLLVYTIQGPFFFGVTEKMMQLLSTTHTQPKNIIFRLSEVPFMDMTGLDAFKETIQWLHKHGANVYVCEANVRVTGKLKRMNVLTELSDPRIFGSLKEVIHLLNP